MQTLDCHCHVLIASSDIHVRYILIHFVIKAPMVSRALRYGRMFCRYILPLSPCGRSEARSTSPQTFSLVQAPMGYAWHVVSLGTKKILFFLLLPCRDGITLTGMPVLPHRHTGWMDGCVEWK